MSLDLEASALKKVVYRLIPFVALLYFAAFIDRVNVSFAAAQMNRDLGFSAYLIGHDSGAEHGVPVDLRGLPAAGWKSTNKPAARAA